MKYILKIIFATTFILTSTNLYATESNNGGSSSNPASGKPADFETIDPDLKTLYYGNGAISSGEAQVLVTCSSLGDSVKTVYPIPVKVEFYDRSGTFDDDVTGNITGQGASIILGAFTNDEATQFSPDAVANTNGFSGGLIRVLVPKKAASVVFCTAHNYDDNNNPTTWVQPLQLIRTVRSLKLPKDVKN